MNYLIVSNKSEFETRNIDLLSKTQVITLPDFLGQENLGQLYEEWFCKPPLGVGLNYARPNGIVAYYDELIHNAEKTI